jgi:hypothetical protein
MDQERKSSSIITLGDFIMRNKPEGIRCWTLEEAKRLCAELDAAGIKWNDGSRYSDFTLFDWYHKDSYYFNDGSIGTAQTAIWASYYGGEDVELHDFSSVDFSVTSALSQHDLSYLSQVLAPYEETKNTLVLIRKKHLRKPLFRTAAMRSEFALHLSLKGIRQDIVIPIVGDMFSPLLTDRSYTPCQLGLRPKRAE